MCRLLAMSHRPILSAEAEALIDLQRLRELGWIEGQTITIESRWGAGRTERLDEIAAEFVRPKPT